MTTTSAQPDGSDALGRLDPGAGLAELQRVAEDLVAAVDSVIQGKDETVRLALTVLFAGGHLLVEDVPGVGKTMLAKAVARSIAGTVRRIQFTPDLLPGDVTGSTVFSADRGEFDFRPGAVFANVVIGDEINRASPKTQSALLECMEEGQVTVDGTTHLLTPPFLVVATQNPVEMDGTYPLPEAQRDRFMARTSMGYPSAAAELSMLGAHGRSEPIDVLSPVVDVATVQRLIEAARAVYVAGAVEEYVVALVRRTREHPDVRLGASPRAGLHLVRAARARAGMQGRDHVLPDDVQALAGPVLAHRLLPTADAVLGGRDGADVIADVLRTTPLPRPR